MVANVIARMWPAVWLVLFTLGWADPAPVIKTPLLASWGMDVVFGLAAVGAAALIAAPRNPVVRYIATVTGVAACVSRASVFAFTPNADGTLPWLVITTWFVLAASWAVLTALSWWVVEHHRHRRLV